MLKRQKRMEVEAENHRRNFDQLKTAIAETDARLDAFLERMRRKVETQRNKTGVVRPFDVVKGGAR